MSLVSLKQKWKRVQPVGQVTTRHSVICEWRGLAEFSASDRSAQEFTGDSCLTLEMPRNTPPSPPTHTAYTLGATTAFARSSSAVSDYILFIQMSLFHSLCSIRNGDFHGS